MKPCSSQVASARRVALAASVALTVGTPSGDLRTVASRGHIGWLGMEK